MQITWTNCAEQMPPDTVDKVISRVGDKLYAVSGSLVCAEYLRWKNYSTVLVEWAPYTPEKWEELNK